MNIQTVLGPVPVDQLGKTLMHEHVFVSFPGAEFDPRYTFDRKAFVALAVSRLNDLSLAQRYARALREQAPGAAVPSWARQAEIFLLEDLD